MIVTTTAKPPLRVRSTLPGWPHFAEDERRAVDRVLASGKVNQWTGTEVREFEHELAAFHGVPHAIALANGTVALELALRAFGIGPGDEVVVPSRTFVATASAVAICGATPVCADVDRESGNVTARTIEAALTPRTKAVIPVHLGGWPCDMDPIMELARSRGLKVIEDCAQAIGARYKGRPVGTIGDVGALSFCQDKIMTTGGEGGAVLTRDPSLWSWMWSFKDHGKSYETTFLKQHPPGFRWLHESFGTNWRMTEMQAAIGRAQLAKLPEWLAARKRNAGILAEAAAKSPAVRVPLPPPSVESAWYKFYMFAEPAALAPGKSRDSIMADLNARGLPTTVGSCSEIYRELAFVNAGLAPTAPFPVAADLTATSLMLMVHPTLGRDHVEEMASVLADALEAATR